MNTFAIVALAWIPVAAGLVVGSAFFLGWLEDRAGSAGRAMAE